MGLARALSSDVGWRILDLLVKSELTESQISRTLRLPIKLVHSHLESLLYSGLVLVDTKTRPDSRETDVYSVTRTAKFVGFPPRSYEYLSEALISGLVTSVGEDGAKMLLRDIGLKLGEKMGNTLRSMSGPQEWTPRTHADFFVNHLLVEMKTFPRLTEVGRDRLTYEQLNCPFQELADKLPHIVCDVIDEAVHSGLDNVLGVKTVRLSCKGHGDPICRFCVLWKNRKHHRNGQ